jgi:predicted dinucleotide-binding enzyme
MRIAVIGNGNVGGALAGRWRQVGHEVTAGVRHPPEPSSGSGEASVRAVGDAIAAAEVVVLAVPGGSVPALLEEQGPALGDRVVVDAANRIGEPVFNSRRDLARSAPSTHYVRAFNTLGWENFAQPLDGADLMYVADPEARQVAEQLIADVGLRPVYVGDADVTETLDALLPLWFALVKQRGGARRLALRLVEQT